MGSWKSEYDWITFPRGHSESRKTVLCTLFDHGAQRQFSRVRITLLCGDGVTDDHREAWRVEPLSSPISVVDCDSQKSKNNDSSLPICDIVFVANQHSARSQTISDEAKLCGELNLCDKSPDDHSSYATIFSFDQVLTENTQSVSVSFASSYLLCTMFIHGTFTEPSADRSATVGRVVRILPNVPMNERRSISLPVDVLWPIFENLRHPQTYRHWGRDVMSSALVCREWTCALDVLLLDFRSEQDERGHPPDIVNLANALVARPSLGLGIKYLSASYLEKHPNWQPFPAVPLGLPSPMFLAKMHLQLGNSHRARFGRAFLSILRVARNLQTLVIEPRKDLVVSPVDLADALCGLSKLEMFSCHCNVTMAQLIACIATWPSLKRLVVSHVSPPPIDRIRGAALASPSCRLTEIDMRNVTILDEELVALVSSSCTSLEQLSLDHCLLTNAGLLSALDTVRASLKSLFLSELRATVDGEEPALDAVVARMERLEDLDIVPYAASERMLERRTAAYVQRCPVLPEVRLHLIVGRDSDVPLEGLVGATGRAWPGWTMVER